MPGKSQQRSSCLKEDRAKVKEARTLAKAVQRRIAAALKQHLEARNADREKKARLPKEKPSRMNRKRIEQRRREATEHKLERLPCGSLRCTECGQNCAARAVKEWLESTEGKTCAGTKPTLQDHTRVEARRGNTVTRIGASFAHASHALALTAGTWWCQVCGAHAAAAEGRASPKFLKDVCAGAAATRGGRQNIKKLEKGERPRARKKEAEL